MTRAVSQRVWGGVLAVGVALALVTAVTGGGELATEAPYRVDLQLIGQDEPRATVWVDPRSGTVRVFRGRIGPTDYIVTTDRVLVPASVVPQVPRGFEWVSLPRLTFGILVSVTSSSIADTLVLDVKECKLVAERAAIDLVTVLIKQSQRNQTFEACGYGVTGGVFADGANISAVFSSEVDPEAFDPTSSAVWIPEEVDPRYGSVVETVRELFTPDG